MNFKLIYLSILIGFLNLNIVSAQKDKEYTDRDYEPLVNLSHKINSDKGVYLKCMTIPQTNPKEANKATKLFKPDTFSITKTIKGARFNFILTKGQQVYFIKKDSTFVFNLKGDKKLGLLNSGEIVNMLRALYVIPTEFLDLNQEQIDNMKMMHFIEIYYTKPTGVSFLIRAISNLKDRPYSIVFSTDLKTQELFGFESAVNGYNNGRYKTLAFGWAEDNKDELVLKGLMALKNTPESKIIKLDMKASTPYFK